MIIKKGLIGIIFPMYIKERENNKKHHISNYALDIQIHILHSIKRIKIKQTNVYYYYYKF